MKKVLEPVSENLIQKKRTGTGTTKNVTKNEYRNRYRKNLILKIGTGTGKIGICTGKIGTGTGNISGTITLCPALKSQS